MTFLITMFTSNQAALLATSQPRQQSGQVSIGEIYAAVRALRQKGNRVRIVWVPSHGDFELSRKAKEVAREATEQDQEPREQFPQMKSTTIQVATAKHAIHNTRKQKVRCHLCTEEKTFSRNDALTRHFRVCHPDHVELTKSRRRNARD